MKEITLDELYEQVREIERNTSEPQEVADKISVMADNFIDISQSGKAIKILTDYDCDGICFGYITERTLKALNPSIDVQVVCNDRRNAYGVPKNITAEQNTQYIVGDMGSNELDYIQATFGKDTLILDHHIISDENARTQFVSDPHLLNAHSIICEDGKSADYCATGLAFRVYQNVVDKLAHNTDYKRAYNNLNDEKFTNTLMAVAAIGTATDMVNVLDPHSHNRQILKNGLNAINNASEKNFDYSIGHFLAASGINDTVTAKKLAFNVGSLINSSSRMSELINENGAQKMYECFSGAHSSSTYFLLDDLVKLNNEKKEYVLSLKDKRYYDFIDSHCRGDLKSVGVAIYELPANTPSAFAGLIAAQIADATDKPSVVIAYNEKDKVFIGSARNVEGKESFVDFVSRALSDKQIDIKYGGHADAFGISRIGSREDADKFIDALTTGEKPQSLSNEEIRLKLTSEEIATLSKSKKGNEEGLPQDNGQDVLVQKLLALEPIGTGFKLPLVEVEGKALKGNVKKNNPRWFDLKIKDFGKITDWNYVESNYPKDKNGNIKVLCTMELSDFRNLHAAFTAKYDEGFYAQRKKDLMMQDIELPSYG